MFPIAWITLRRINEKSILIIFGVVALVMIYVGLGWDTIFTSTSTDTAVASEQTGVGIACLFLSVFSIFWCTIEIPRELARQEVLVYLSKPISRLRYLVGKYLGMLGMILGGEVVLLGIFACARIFSGYPPTSAFFYGVARTAMALALLNAICTAVSALLPEIPALVIVLTIAGAGIFVFSFAIIAWSNYDLLPMLSWKSAYYLLPNVMHFRWDAADNQSAYLAALLLYTVGWCTVLLLLSHILFLRRDLH